MGWKDYRARNGHADFCRQRVIEKFVIGAPPKWIVYHSRCGERGVLKPGAIERDVLRDAVDHNVVTAWLALNHFVDPDELCGNLFAAGLLVNPLDKGRRKTLLLSKKNSDFLHNYISVISSESNLLLTCPAAR